jgi:hypothetical protein
VRWSPALVAPWLVALDPAVDGPDQGARCGWLDAIGTVMTYQPVMSLTG